MQKLRKYGLGAVISLLSLTLSAGGAILPVHADNSTPVTLTVWDEGLLGHLTDGALDTKSSYIYVAAQDYEALHPNVKIKIDELDSGVYQAQFTAASIAKNGPDIRIGFAGGDTLSYSQYLVNLRSYFTTAELKQIAGLNTSKANYSLTGALYGVPFGAGSYFVVFYNKKMMAAAHINMTTPPQTWEQFIELAKKIKATGVTPLYDGNLEGYTGAWVIPPLVGGLLGPNAFTDMYQSKTSINQAAMVKAYAAYQQLYTNGITNADATTLSDGSRITGFIAGKGVMTINGGWSNDQLYKSMGDNVGEFPIPTLAGSRYPNILPGGTNEALAVTKYSRNKATSVDFIKFLISASEEDKYVSISQTEPSNNLGANPKVITNPLLKQQAKWVTMYPQVYPFDNIMPSNVINLYYQVNNSVALLQTTPADAAKKLADSFSQNLPTKQ
jgi:raffinose/stachyose/melibiose transport system substrate-binding protein